MNYNNDSSIQQLQFWPKSEFSFRSLVRIPAREEEVERFFNQLYSPHKTLLFSSGRVAIKKILEVEDFRRDMMVGVMAYTSHCVLNALSTYVTPTQLANNESYLYLVYHNYGYPKILETERYVIEDSADSLCLDNSELFKNKNSLYEVFSLPKILGSNFGGIVVCKNEEAYQRLKSKRDATEELNANMVCLLRSARSRMKFAHYLWEGAAIYSAKCSYFAVANILDSLKTFDTKVKIREKNIQMISTRFESHPVTSRLPCAFPIEPESIKDEYLPRLSHLIRHIYLDDYPMRGLRLQKRLLLPIHHDLGPDSLSKILSLIIR